MTYYVPEENPSLCFQCAKCSTGCPLAAEMDLLPHQIIHFMALGMEDEILSKKTPWVCASCYSCAVRCPNDIDVTALMNRLRQKAISTNTPCPMPEVLLFHKNFINDFSRRGKIHELRMMADFNLKSGHLFKNINLVPQMFRKGRLLLLPPGRTLGFKKWLRNLGKSPK